MALVGIQLFFQKFWKKGCGKKCSFRLIKLSSLVELNGVGNGERTHGKSTKQHKSSLELKTDALENGCLSQQSRLFQKFCYLVAGFRVQDTP